MAKGDTKLVATRVSLDSFKTLRIGLVVEDAETMQELLRPVIERYAEELQREPEVQAISTKAQEYSDRKQGVRRMPPKRASKKAATKRRKP